MGGMMETEMLLRVTAVIIAGAILLSNFDYSYVVSYIKSLFTWKKPNFPDVKKEVSFLEIVATWHKLRNQCEAYGLDDAVAKIDEVFPLLNVEE